MVYERKRPHDKKIWDKYWSEQTTGSSITWEKQPKVVDFIHDNLPKGVETIYEFGCGPGKLMDLLQSRNPHLKIKGVDISLDTNQMFGDKFVGAALEELPFKDDSLEGGYSTFTLTHTNMEQSTKELWRVLKPGAKLILVIHRRGSTIQGAMEGRYMNSSNEISIIKKALEKGEEEPRHKDLLKSHSEELDDVAPIVETITRAFNNADEAKDFFEDYGFTVEQSKAIRDEAMGSGTIGIGLVLKKNSKPGKQEKQAHPVVKRERSHEIKALSDSIEAWMINIHS